MVTILWLIRHIRQVLKYFNVRSDNAQNVEDTVGPRNSALMRLNKQRVVTKTSLS